jgi:hypothetical protein
VVSGKDVSRVLEAQPLLLWLSMPLGLHVLFYRGSEWNESHKLVAAWTRNQWIFLLSKCSWVLANIKAATTCCCFQKCEKKIFVYCSDPNFLSRSLYTYLQPVYEADEGSGEQLVTAFHNESKGLILGRWPLQACFWLHLHPLCLFWCGQNWWNCYFRSVFLKFICNLMDI